MARKSAGTTAGRTGRRARSSDDGTLALALFDRVMTAPSWRPWRSWLCAVLGLPLDEAGADVYRRCTGRAALPSGACREVWTVAGRRSGTRWRGSNFDNALGSA